MMQRPLANRPERIRVELRLQPAVATILYGWANDANISLSEAGNQLISLGAMHHRQRGEKR
jgi:hypothetical protein